MLEVVVERARIDGLEREGDATVELPLPGRRERRERSLLEEAVAEDVLRLRVTPLLAVRPLMSLSPHILSRCAD